MRVVPRENEAINETWIADRDRFSYEGVYSEDRLDAPDACGAAREWVETDWESALMQVADGLQARAPDLGVLASSTGTLEELYLRTVWRADWAPTTSTTACGSVISATRKPTRSSPASGCRSPTSRGSMHCCSSARTCGARRRCWRTGCARPPGAVRRCASQSGAASRICFR